MSDDPNKRQNEGTGSSGHGSQQSGQKPGHQSDEPQKRPSQGGSETGKDREESEHGGQRRAS